MIETQIVRQIESYMPVAELLERELIRIQSRGHKVLNVIETKGNNIPGLSNQNFMILYDTGSEGEEPRFFIQEDGTITPINVGHDTHELKIIPKWFDDVKEGRKNFEIRRADRDFKVGDYLILREWNKGKFTKRFLIRQIEYIYQGDGSYGLSEEFCILGIKVPKGVQMQ